ncbi:MAG: hypothetical protein JW901_02170 [Dehalococcoidia bacterium]|nr:hypothetical protein [Dehalococcoidia bacterium]
MKRPPMLITMRFQPDSEVENSHGFSICIPLFIIVPVVLLIVLPLLLLALPFLFVYVLITWDIGWWRYIRYGAPAFFETIHALLGLEVAVEDRNRKIYIDVN